MHEMIHRVKDRRDSHLNSQTTKHRLQSDVVHQMEGMMMTMTRLSSLRTRQTTRTNSETTNPLKMRTKMRTTRLPSPPTRQTTMHVETLMNPDPPPQFYPPNLGNDAEDLISALHAQSATIGSPRRNIWNITCPLCTTQTAAKCKYCSKRFPTAKNRLCHHRVHTGIKNKACMEPVFHKLLPQEPYPRQAHQR